MEITNLASGNTQATGPVLCVINQKGGSGKSSTCYHLAGHFAETGKNVLVVDVDPQGSLSQGFLGSTFVEQLKPEQTVAMAFDDGAYFCLENRLARPTAFDRISIVPANHHLQAHNRPEPESRGMEQQAIQTLLECLPGYDLVLLDCPPNLYQCTWSALVAADYVLIPVPPEDFGTQGLRAVHQAIEGAQILNPRLQLLGHVVSRTDSRLAVHRIYEKRLREIYGKAVFDTIIPEAAAFKTALACRKPVTYSATKSKAAHLTRNLGCEILHRITASKPRMQPSWKSPAAIEA